METKFVEVTNGPNNFGKFMVARFSDEHWRYTSRIESLPLLRARGWNRNNLLVLDLQTGEGVIPISAWRREL